MTTPLVLGVIALVLSGPVPALMMRAPWLRRTPFATLLMWQAAALGGVLAALGAGVSLITSQVWERDLGAPNVVVAVLAATMTVTVVGRLLMSGHLTGTRLRQVRSRHRDMVDVVGMADRDLRVLDHPLPVAYCLPGMATGRVVVSRATLEDLSSSQVAAVMAHERSHLRWRHDLVIEAFTVLHRAFPSWGPGVHARGEVELLVEALADRAASRSAGPVAVLSALLALGAVKSPAGSLGARGSGLAERAQILADTRTHRVQSTLIGAIALGVLVLPTLLVVWPWVAALA